MTTAKKRPVRSKTQLHEEMETLQNKIASQESLDPTARVTAEKRRQELINVSKRFTLEGVVADLGRIGMEAQASVDNVKNLLGDAVKKLADAVEARDEFATELEELHGKDIVAASLAELLEEHKAAQAEFEIERDRRLNELQSRLADQLRVEAERKTTVEKTRKQDEDDYQYKTTLLRRAAEDQWKQQVQQTQRAFDDQMYAKDKNWREREAELKVREHEFNAAIQRITELPTEIETEKKKAVDSVARAMKQDYEHKMALFEAQAKSDKALADAEIKSLRDKLSGDSVLIANLHGKLEAAEKRVESIANNALAASSGRQALEAASAMASTLKDNNSRKS